MDGWLAPAQCGQKRVEDFTCRSQNLAEVLSDCILQVPGSRSHRLAEGPQVHWGPLSASAEVCLQDTHTNTPTHFSQSFTSDKT